MKLAAIDAAVGIGFPEAIDSLLELLHADDDDIIDAASEALTMLEDGDFDDPHERRCLVTLKWL